jgi:hypothetical protein
LSLTPPARRRSSDQRCGPSTRSTKTKDAHRAVVRSKSRLPGQAGSRTFPRLRSSTYSPHQKVRTSPREVPST